MGRQVVRFLKGWSKCDPSLHDITSYYWKNALFHLMDYDKEGWESKNFPERFFQLIWIMSRLVEYKELPVYFNIKMNLFKDMTPTQSERISKRLKSLYMKEAKFDKVFKYVAKDAINEDKNLKDEKPKQKESSESLTEDDNVGLLDFGGQGDSGSHDDDVGIDSDDVHGIVACDNNVVNNIIGCQDDSDSNGNSDEDVCDSDNGVGGTFDDSDDYGDEDYSDEDDRIEYYPQDDYEHDFENTCGHFSSSSSDSSF